MILVNETENENMNKREVTQIHRIHSIENSHITPIHSCSHYCIKFKGGFAVGHKLGINSYSVFNSKNMALDLEHCLIPTAKHY